jgi:hypothetical protein
MCFYTLWQPSCNAFCAHAQAHAHGTDEIDQTNGRKTHFSGSLSTRITEPQTCICDKSFLSASWLRSTTVSQGTQPLFPQEIACLSAESRCSKWHGHKVLFSHLPAWQCLQLEQGKPLDVETRHKKKGGHICSRDSRCHCADFKT